MVKYDKKHQDMWQYMDRERERCISECRPIGDINLNG
jgi:hypothetical protein